VNSKRRRRGAKRPARRLAPNLLFSSNSRESLRRLSSPKSYGRLRTNFHVIAAVKNTSILEFETLDELSNGQKLSMIFKRKETVRKWSGTSHRVNSYGLITEINERERAATSHMTKTIHHQWPRNAGDRCQLLW